MKIKFRNVAALGCAAVCALSFTACAGRGAGTAGSGQSGIPIGGNIGNVDPPPVVDSKDAKLLGAPKAVEDVHYSTYYTDEYKAFQRSVERFAADFAACSYADYKKQDNFTVSPISVYMALALSAECAANDTRKELLDALGVTHEQLKTHFTALYASLDAEYKYDGKTSGMLKLSNSIWVNEGTEVKQPCIDALSDDYYAYSYSADFEHNNAQANKAVRDFVKQQTRGLIDQDFQLSDETLFALINTLYLKTIWNSHGDDLPFAPDRYNFTAKDGSVQNVPLLEGYYNEGKAAEFDTFSTFYTQTYHGHKIKFILPKDGYTVDQVFTADNIAAVNNITDHGAYNESRTEHYTTRVLFPEYKCKYDENVAATLQKNFGIDLFFKDSTAYPDKSCDFSTLTDDLCHCAKVQHVTDLTVNRKGIEGAAVTVIDMVGDSAPEPMMEITADFVVNKAFGFIITDYRNVTLFSGVVNNI